MFYYILCHRQPTRSYSSLIKNALSKKPIPVSSINLNKLNPIWMLVGSVGFIGYRYLLNGSNIVHCHHIELERTSENHFDWNKLLSYLSPDLLNLIAAIVVSILIRKPLSSFNKKYQYNILYLIIFLV